MEHLIIFPLPLNIHIGFVVISVIFLILCYLKKKYTYELYMLIGIVSTLFIYVCGEKPYFYILGAEEITLLVLTIIDMAKVSKALAAAEKAEKEKKTEETTDESVQDNDDVK